MVSFLCHIIAHIIAHTRVLLLMFMMAVTMSLACSGSFSIVIAANAETVAYTRYNNSVILGNDEFFRIHLSVSSSWEASQYNCWLEGGRLAAFRSREQLNELVAAFFTDRCHVSGLEGGTNFLGDFTWFTDPQLGTGGAFRWVNYIFSSNDEPRTKNVTGMLPWCYADGVYPNAEPNGWGGGLPSVVRWSKNAQGVGQGACIEDTNVNLGCAYCVKHRCNIDDDCNYDGAHSVNGTYFPNCVCNCKEGFVGPRCVPAPTLIGNIEVTPVFQGSPAMHHISVCAAAAPYLLPLAITNKFTYDGVRDLLNTPAIRKKGQDPIYSQQCIFDGRWLMADEGPYTVSAIYQTGRTAGQRFSDALNPDWFVWDAERRNSMGLGRNLRLAFHHSQARGVEDVDGTQTYECFLCARYRCNIEDDCVPRGSHDFVAVSASGYWPDCSCTVLHQNDEISFNSRETDFTWSQAKSFCESEPNRYLSVPRNAAQWAVLRLAHEHYTKGHWIGIRERSTRTGEYHAVGGRWDSFTVAEATSPDKLAFPFGLSMNGMWQPLASRGSSGRTEVASTGTNAVSALATLGPTSKLPAVACTMHRCNSLDDCSGHGTVVNASAYYPDCQCACDAGYSGSRCETVENQGDVITRVCMDATNAHLYGFSVTQASAGCASLGGHLATVRNQQQWDEVYAADGAAYSAVAADAWIGGSTAAGSNAWQWPTDRFKRFGTIFSADKTPVSPFYIGWSATAYATNVNPRSMALRLHATDPLVATAFHTSSSTPLHKCYYCALRYVCSIEDDCAPRYGSDEAVAVNGTWPDCACTCRLGLPCNSASASATMTKSAVATASATQSLTPTASLTNTLTASQPAPRSASLSLTKSSLPTATAAATSTVQVPRTRSASPSPSVLATPSRTLIRTSSASLTESVVPTVTPSRELTSTKTRPPPPPPPPPVLVPQKTLSDVGYGHRYVESEDVKRQLDEPHGGVPLQFVQGYEVFAGRRFLISSPAGGGKLRFVLGPYANSVRRDRYIFGYGDGVAADTEGIVWTGVSMTKTSNAMLDYIQFNDVPMQNFIHPRSPAHTIPTLVLPDMACGDLTTLTPVTVVPRINSSIESGSIRIAAGPIALFPQCYANVRLAGVVYSSSGFVGVATVAYAHLVFVEEHATVKHFLETSWDGGEVSRRERAVVDANGTVVMSSPPLMRLASVLPSVTLVGDPVSPRRLPPPANIYALAAIAPAVTPEDEETARNNNTTNTISESVIISNRTHLSAVCTVGDQSSFSATFVNASVPLNYTMPSGCFMYDTVNDLHLACMNTPSCVGFTTIMMQGPREMPLCMYSGFLGSDPSGATATSRDVMPYLRMFYRNPAASPSRAGAKAAPAAPCSVHVEYSGAIAVYVQQTMMASGQAVVRVNGAYVATCGGTSNFLHNVVGRDGRCNQWVLCYAGRVPMGADVSVETPTVLAQGGCDNSLGVIVTQTEIDRTQVVSTKEAPIERVDTSGMLGRSIVKHATSHEDPIRLFVFNGRSAALEVQQTGYSCAVPSSSCPKDSSPIAFSTTSSCQFCGGFSGFLNGRSGMSDRCETSQFCGEVLPLQGLGDLSCAVNAKLVPSMPYTGTVSVAARTGALSYQSSLCTGFSATVYVLRHVAAIAEGAVAQTPLFPLIASGSGGSGVTFATLLGVPHGSNYTVAELTNVAPSVAAQTITKITSVGPSDGRLDVHYVPWTTLYGIGTNYQSRLHRNSTQVCIVDHALEQGVQCTFYIPKGSTYVRVSAAQTDFATNKAMTVRVSLDGGMTDSSVDTCGGSKHSFGRIRGQEGQCGSFLTCTDRFMYRNDSLAEDNTEGIVTVSLPAGLRCHGCDFIATIIVEFSNPLLGPVDCAEYECPGERRCLPYSYLCDGVQDCNANTDEKYCGAYIELPDEIFCRNLNSTNTKSMTVVGGSFDLCRLFATQHSSTVFFIEGSECTIIVEEMVPVVLSVPDSFVCNRSGARTYFVPPADERLSFALCRRSVQCFGHGTASLSNGVCACTCDDGFAGTDCSQPLRLERITTIVVALNTTDGVSTNYAALASALELSSRNIAVTCKQAMLDTSAGATIASALLVSCTLSARDGRLSEELSHQQRLLSPDTAWPVIRASLAVANEPYLLYITARTTMNPEVEMARCDTVSASQPASVEATSPAAVLYSGALCPVTVEHERFRFVAQHSVRVLSATLVFWGSDQSATPGRRAGADVATYSCTQMSSIPTNGGCYQSTCDVPIKADVGTIVNVTDVVYADADVFTSDCDDPHFSLTAEVAYGNANTVTNTNVLNEATSYLSFLVGGIIVFVVGALAAWTMSAVCMLQFRKQYRATEQAHLGRRDGEMEDAMADRDNDLAPVNEQTVHPRLSDTDTLSEKKTSMLVSLRLERDVDGVRRDKASAAFLVVGFVLAMFASFLFVYYATAYGLESNFQVMFEEYSDAYCDGSAAAYMPRRIFAVPAGSWECERMQSTGEAAGSTFATGECSGENGAYTVEFTMGTSLFGCRTSTQRVSVPSGTCMPIRSIMPESTRNTFVKLTCSTSDLIMQREKNLRTLTGFVDSFELGELRDPNPRLAPTEAGSGDSTIVTVPYRVGSTVADSTSYTASTVASMITAPTGTIDGLAAILQQPECVFSANTGAACPAGSEGDLVNALLGLPIDASSYVTLPGSSAAQLVTRPPPTALTPAMRNAPVGHVYNGFNTNEAATWSGAGMGAHRYYGIARGLFDMGAHFPKDRDDPQDEEGFAVSMWLRVSSATLGFAYAVTDAFEDITTGQVHPLDRLGAIMESGGGGHSWFNVSYQVYHSLYVNGPGASLTFAYTARTALDSEGRNVDGRVVQIEYDLRDINAHHLFNGQWHHVAVSMEVDNGKVRAQLVVDGETSYTKVGWGHCVASLPQAVAEAPPTDSATGQPYVFSRISDAVTRRGLLVIGYLNGGVSNLRAFKHPIERVDVLREGTEAMRQRNPFDEDATLGLGITVLTIGAVLLAVVVRVSVRDVKYVFSSSSTGVYWQTASRFYRHQRRFRRNQRKNNPFARSVRPIRLFTALRWIGVSPSDFCVIMDEIESQRIADPSAAIMLFLFQIKLDNPLLTRIAPATWNAFEDARLSDMLDDVARSGGNVQVDKEGLAAGKGLPATFGPDLFAQVFKWSPPKLAAESDEFDDINRSPTNDSKRFGGQSRSRSLLTGPNIEGKVDFGAVGGIGAGFGGGGGAGAAVQQPVAPLAGGSDSTVATTEAVGFLTAAISSFQGIYVWATSIQLPTIYIDVFGDFFSFLSIDFAAVFEGIPAIVTPLLQVFAGLGCLGLVAYFLYTDDRTYRMVLGRYVWRRDEIEFPELHNKLSEALPKSLTEVLASEVVADEPPCTRVLAVKESRAVDQFVAAQKKLKGKKSKAADGEAGDEEGVEADANARKKSIGDDSPLPVTRAAGQRPSVAEEENPLAALVAHRSSVIVMPSMSSLLNGGAPPPVSHIKCPDGTECALQYDHEEKAVFALKEGSGAQSGDENEGGDDPTSEPRRIPLQAAGCYCPHHPTVVLAPQVQTEVWPLTHRPRCCVAVDRTLCAKDVGMIFRCGQTWEEEVEVEGDEEQPSEENMILSIDPAGGEASTEKKKKTVVVRHVCTYAMCEAHFRPSIPELIKSQVLGAVHLLRGNGYAWLLCLVAFAVTNACYTPFMKTALMIVSCHPYYQCVFDRCWSNMDQKFAVAAFLAIAFIVLFGLGFPCLLFALLNHRRRLMEKVFLNKAYGGAYSTLPFDPTGLEINNNNSSDNSKVNSATFSKVANGSRSEFVVALQRSSPQVEMEMLMVDSSTSLKQQERRQRDGAGCDESHDESGVQQYSPLRASPAAERGAALENAELTGKSVVETKPSVTESLPIRLKRVLTRPTNHVSEAEWQRFVSTDASALSGQYARLRPNWLYFPSLLVLFQVAVLLPALFIEERTFEQRLGCAIVEVVLAFIVFAVSPFVSPVMTCSLRLGRVHQLIQLGLLNIELAVKNRASMQANAPSSSSDTLSTSNASVVANCMLGVTIVYLLITLVGFLAGILWPVIGLTLQDFKLEKLLTRYSLVYSNTITLYKDPIFYAKSLAEAEAAATGDEVTVFGDDEPRPPNDKREPLICPLPTPHGHWDDSDEEDDASATDTRSDGSECGRRHCQCCECRARYGALRRGASHSAALNAPAPL